VPEKEQLGPKKRLPQKGPFKITREDRRNGRYGHGTTGGGGGKYQKKVSLRGSEEKDGIHPGKNRAPKHRRTVGFLTQDS